MRRFIVDRMRHGLAGKRRFVKQLTCADAIREFIRSVRPIGAGHPGFPHPLDRDNTTRPSLPLPPVWHADV